MKILLQPKNNKVLKSVFLILILVTFTACVENNKSSEINVEAQNKIAIKKKQLQDSIIEKYVTNGSSKFNYKFQMQEWQQCLDEGLKVDSTVAYLWQQKAMPYFKARKYEIGMSYIDKAVLYDREGWLPYRAFIKCIFAKTYKDAIVDFEECKKRYGNMYVMDHTYDFYIAISYLQLNEFEKSENLLQGYVDGLFDKLGEEWVHPTALFYLGISKYELKKYEEAIKQFDRALELHPNLSEAHFYKTICLGKLKNKTKVNLSYQAYLKTSKLGYSINEDNAVYETYPYQLRLPK